MKAITVEWECGCGFVMQFNVTPARQAPPCSNPDSPAFSDSGDPAEIEGPTECPACGCETETDLPAIEQKAYDSIPTEGDDSQEDRIEEEM